MCKEYHEVHEKSLSRKVCIPSFGLTTIGHLQNHYTWHRNRMLLTIRISRIPICNRNHNIPDILITLSSISRPTIYSGQILGVPILCRGVYIYNNVSSIVGGQLSRRGCITILMPDVFSRIYLAVYITCIHRRRECKGQSFGPPGNSG